MVRSAGLVWTTTVRHLVLEKQSPISDYVLHIHKGRSTPALHNIQLSSECNNSEIIIIINNNVGKLCRGRLATTAGSDHYRLWPRPRDPRPITALRNCTFDLPSVDSSTTARGWRIQEIADNKPGMLISVLRPGTWGSGDTSVQSEPNLSDMQFLLLLRCFSAASLSSVMPDGDEADGVITSLARREDHGLHDTENWYPMTLDFFAVGRTPRHAIPVMLPTAWPPVRSPVDRHPPEPSSRRFYRVRVLCDGTVLVKRWWPLWPLVSIAPSSTKTENLLTTPQLNHDLS